MTKFDGGYEIDDDVSRVDLDLVLGWIAGSYWNPDVKPEELRRATMNSSLVVGCYQGVLQVGFLRVASDKARFAYVMDVFVEQGHRKKGIGREMMRFAMGHPELEMVYIWTLATMDAHDVYTDLGYAPLSQPERWMMSRLEKRW